MYHSLSKIGINTYNYCQILVVSVMTVPATDPERNAGWLIIGRYEVLNYSTNKLCTSHKLLYDV